MIVIRTDRILPALFASACLLGLSISGAEEENHHPAMRDFIGICGHTVGFKPELYKQVCRLVRDYHPVGWDLGDDSDYKTTFPMARNQVSWKDIYGSWRKSGFDTDVSLMFEGIKQKTWKDVPKDAFAYGQAFASYFGPSGNKLVDAAEVGNEPGNWDDASYRIMFENMAKGLRAGDPKLRIATCAADAKKSGGYMKALSCIAGLENLYDIINVHTYAMVENWPTWRRSYPEDPKLLDYLSRPQEIIDWRNANAPKKEIWITEFGYDSTTKPNKPTGDFKNWVGVNDTQMGQWLVRSFFVFSSMAIDRAYIYFFDDADEPQLHGASGLTRNFKPKPAFYAVAHLYRTLGDYRFVKAVTEKAGERRVYEYQHVSDPKKRIWAVWSPTGNERSEEGVVTGLPGEVVKAERMPLASGDEAAAATFAAKPNHSVGVTITESPLYLWIQMK
jgi:serine/threonine-protein kinase ATR